MLVVGLSGKIGTGKTGLAKALVNRFPDGMAVRVAFGDLLKQECAEACGFPVGWCYNQKDKETRLVLVPRFLRYLFDQDYAFVREMLQVYGTGYRRKQDPGYWVVAMGKALDELKFSGVRVAVIDDVRFQDEADMVLGLGGILYRLMPYDGWAPGPFAGHESETALDGFEGFAKWLHPSFGDLGECSSCIFQYITGGCYDSNA